MTGKHWRQQAVGLLGIACLCAATAHGQERPALKVEPGDVSLRLERLERQNDDLQQQNEQLRKLIERLDKQTAPVSDASSALSKQDVQQIVTEYLQGQDKKQGPGSEAKNVTPAAPASPTWHQVGSDLKLGVSWANGLTVESAQKDFKMHVGGRINADWIWWGEPSELRAGTPTGLGSLEDGVSFRRARLVTDGSLWEVFEWMGEFDFAGQAAVLSAAKLNPDGSLSTTVGTSTLITYDDFWIGVTQIPFLGTFRAGHIKIPFSLESVTSSRFVTFMERGAPFTAFLEEYDPGFLFTNTVADQRGTWGAAFHRIDNQGDFTDYGTGDYAASGRVTALPMWQRDGRCLVHVGASGQYRAGESDGDDRFFRFRTGPELRSRQIGFPSFIDSGSFASDHVNMFGGEAAVVWGPLSIQGEYIGVQADNAARGGGTKDLYFHGWYVYASLFLTGEHRRYDRRLGRFDRVVPNENFFFVRSSDDDGRRSMFGRGAWEIAARISQVDLSQAEVTTSGVLNEYTAAVNWYWNPNMKVQLNYVLADRQMNQAVPQGTSGIVHGVGMRFHYDF